MGGHPITSATIWGAHPDPVTATLMEWAARPFAWGSADCALSVLHYAERVSGRRLEPAPVYSGERGARRYALRRGGFLNVFRVSVEAIGCRRVSATRRGDIGMIELDGVGLTAALCIGDKWAARGHGEVFILPAKPVIAWRVPCPQQ